MGDKTITCIQCNKPFIFSTSDQEWFTQRGFDVPRRCPECRKRKAKVDTSDSGRDKFKSKKIKNLRRKRDIYEDLSEW